MQKRVYRPAVFIVVYSKTNNLIEYLILKRKLHWSGWEFPKGGIEKNENFINAVKRELKEETGLNALKIKKLNFSGKYNYKKVYPNRPGYIGQTFILFSVEVKKEKILFDEREHQGSKWVRLEEGIRKLTYRNQKKSLKIVDNWLRRNHNNT